MLKNYFLIVLVFLLPIGYFAQTHSVVVMGKITDAKSKQNIESVHVKVNQRNIVVKSDQNGNYLIRFDKKKRAILVFSHTSYEINYQPVTSSNDTIYLSVKLKEKIAVLPEFNFDENTDPIPVFKSVKISIADYEFYEDKYLFLAYGKRLNKDSEIYLVDQNEAILSKHFIPGEPVELYTDYMGNVNLICKKAIYRIGVQDDKVSIYELPLDNFNQLIKPIVDTLEGSIYFSDFLYQFPRFKYYSFSLEDTTVSVIKEIVHTDMDWRYSFEYHFLSNADKQFAKRMAKRLKGFDKYDVAAHMTGFSNSFLYEEVYAPMFVINDTINIFDHSEATIWKFVEDTIQVDSIAFTYHEPKKKSEWKRQLIMDEVNGKVYGVFLRNGYYYLKEINSSNGKVANEKKLHYQYVEQLKIKDDFVFYIYKEKGSLTKKFLYKEPI